MFLRRFLSKRGVENVPQHRDALQSRQGGDSETSESEMSTPMYIYYRIYAGDGAIPSNTPAAPGDPFLGRIKALSVPPPYRDTASAVKRTIAKAENIDDRASNMLFLTPYSKLPMDDADKVTILNCASLRSTQQPLAFVANISDSDSERRRSGLAEPDSKTPSEIQYLYYRLYVDDSVIPSKVVIDPEDPSLGRLRADFITPPHNPATIKRFISRVEGNSSLLYAKLFADISCNTPLKENHISIFHTDCPGLSPKNPMAIVQYPVDVVQPPLIPDGRYLIKNRESKDYWIGVDKPSSPHYNSVRFCPISYFGVFNVHYIAHQWDITHDVNGNIFISPYVRLPRPGHASCWVGANFIWSSNPVPWRLIRVDSKFFYLTTDPLNRNPLVPSDRSDLEPQASSFGFHLLAPLMEGEKCQMWEFVRVRFPPNVMYNILNGLNGLGEVLIFLINLLFFGPYFLYIVVTRRLTREDSESM